MEYTNLAISLISLLTGGSLMWVFTIKSTRLKARAEAMKEMQDVYQETIIDLREDKKILKNEYAEIADKEQMWKEKYTHLEKEVELIQKEIKKLQFNAKKEQCVRFDCKERLVS